MNKFVEVVVKIYVNHNGDLGLIAKDIDAASHLDFAKYGDVFFEVFFTGSRSRLGLEFQQYNKIRHYQHKTHIPVSIIHQPSSIIKPSSVIEPSSIIEPSSVIQPSSNFQPSCSRYNVIIHQPSSVIEPSSIIKPSSVIEPSSIVEPSSVIQPSSIIEPSSVIETSSVIQPSSNFQPSCSQYNVIIHQPSSVIQPSSNFQPSYSRYNVDRWINIENSRAQLPYHPPQPFLLRHTYFVLNCESTRQSILPHVEFARKILRKRPFLVENLERVLERFLKSLMKIERIKRKKLAIFISLSFSQKLPGVSPETIFQPLLNDCLVARGISLSFITDVFKEYLDQNSLEDLIKLLRRARIDDNLLHFFPENKRNWEAFSEHFIKEGLRPLVEYYKKKILCMNLKKMKTKLTDLIASNADIPEVIEAVKQDCEAENFHDSDVTQTIWDAIMDAVAWPDKIQKQDARLALHQVKTWSTLFNDLCATEEVQLQLMDKIQQYCYDNAIFTKLFPEIIRLLYDQDVLVEDAIRMWFEKGINRRGRQAFVKSLEPFIKWLDEAEEEE